MEKKLIAEMVIETKEFYTENELPRRKLTGYLTESENNSLQATGNLPREIKP